MTDLTEAIDLVESSLFRMFGDRRYLERLGSPARIRQRVRSYIAAIRVLRREQAKRERDATSARFTVYWGGCQ